ncbi:S-layer homology domain-containing protein [Dysosmobacter sp. NSJ-60]|nr:S-layer homology domain-containing protein [Dysosmobacter hominis]
MHRMFRHALSGLAALCLLLLVPGVHTYARGSGSTGGEVVGYYAGWAAYQGYTPDQLPAEKLTQINYAFAEIDPVAGRIALGDEPNDLKNLKALRKLRSQHPHLKLLISVGGWSDSQYFSDVASTQARREKFASSCVDFVVEHGLDGVDLDWEYPVSGGAPGTIHRNQDKQNFTLLLQELRERLDHQERQDRREYSLTIAGAAGAWYLSQIEPVKVAALVDHIFLMGYDLHGTWNSRTGLNAPLNPVSHASQAGGSIAGSVQAYLERGVPAEKIVLGTPLYGYLYQGVSSRNNGLYSTYTSGKSISYQTLKKTYLASSAYRQFRHEEGQVPYLYGNGTFLSYDDAASIAAKASLARSLGLGGVGFWELSQDSGGELVSAAVQALRSSWDNPFRDVLPGVWYEDAVRYVYEREMMQGTSASAFSPNTSSNRGMLTAILYRLEGSPRSGEPPFTDVAADAYYGKAVAWAEKHGIVQGFDDGTFRPGARITRQQLATVLFRYADFKGEAGRGQADLSAYQDGDRVEAYAREAMAWAVDAGLIQGLADGRLDPGGTATRAQTAVILQRLCEQVLEA